MQRETGEIRVDHGTVFSVWLGVAGLAFCSAHLLLWRARRFLSRARKGTGVPRASRVPTAALNPSTITESASPGLAS